MNGKYNPEDDKEEVEFNKIQADEAAKSPAAQQMALQTLQEEAAKYNLTKEGVASVDNLKEFDARCKRADDIAREVFKDDPGQYDMYCSETGLHDAEQRRALAQAVQAEVKHGMQVAMKTDTEKRSETIANKDMLEAAGTLANVAADAEVATDATNSAYELVDSQHDFGVEQLARQRDEALAKAKTDAERKQIEERFKTLKSGADAATVSARAAIGVESIKALTGISKREEDWARQRAGTLKRDFRNIFMQRYKAHLAMNQSHEIAYANAIAGTRDAAMKYFETRIKAGQVGSVLFTLDQLEKDGDAEFDKTVTEERPTGVYNPSYYSFLRKSDMFALRKSAIEEIHSFERMSKLQMSIEKAKHDLQQDRLEQAANIWKGDVRLKIARGELSTMSSPEQMLSQFLPEIKKFQDAGYEKVDELVSSITAACNGFFKLRDDTQKRYSSMSKSVRQADFARRIEDYRRSEADNVAMTYVLPNGKIARSDAVDRRAALVAFIDVALRDETIDDGAKAAYNEEKKALQAERVKRNANALGILASRCGWRLPTEQTKNVANYRTGMYMEIEGMPSRQTGDTLLFSDKGVPVISNEMTATWTDPENPSLTMTLGASEVRDLFRNAMNTLDQTPEDDLSTLTSSKGGVKSRVEVAFLNALRTAAREKNAKDVYSSLSGAIRMMDNSLFSPSVRTSTRRMDYLHRNAFIPPVVVKKKDDAKKTGK